eukprot:comp22886_c0_seq1/m.36173 comp22886_c0_seq1/g.36173  ORF comp22886_c0_seq1/g.36173 comp22886_c0_seq1/m.36173 type:complete len:441 (-) comp22886_c0_seq1:546-1868(-)
MSLEQLALDKDEYISLLSKLIGEARYLQNSPPKYMPEESRAARHVLKELEPYTQPNGPLVVDLIEYHENRGNVIIQYPATIGDPATAPTIGFVGSHLDVVTAHEENWSFPAFELTIEGDELRGRGTTDCLGHVALLTCLFKHLAINKIPLKVTVAAVFIASEENSSIPGVGVDGLLENGKLDFLKRGPVFWVDSADTHPCVGTCSALTFELTAYGKTFHAGLPHQGINALELVMEASAEIQRRFYSAFGPHAMEANYPFATSSTMKPTLVKIADGSLNALPGKCTLAGDIRIIPFYDVDEAKATMLKWVDEINANIDSLPKRGPFSPYHLPNENRSGRIELTFNSHGNRGIACDLNSPGFQALKAATEEFVGVCTPVAVGGALPLVRDLQEAGLDVQIAGYGVMARYHADNEMCLLSHMVRAFKILAGVVSRIDKNTPSA